MRWTIGGLQVTQVLETVIDVDGQLLFGGAAADIVPTARDWLEPSYLNADGSVPMSFHSLVIESAATRILVDTCIGPHEIPDAGVFARFESAYLANLSAAGFRPRDIDVVVCTHLHVDHTGWNTVVTPSGLVPTFPRARYLFSRTDYEAAAAVGGGRGARTFAATIEPVIRAGQADLVDAPYAVSPEISLLATPGHTRGHFSVAIESEGSSAVITGDMMHHPVQVDRPDVALSLDVDPGLGAATRQAFVTRYTDSGTLVFGTHFAHPSAGFLVRTAQGVRFVS